MRIPKNEKIIISNRCDAMKKKIIVIITICLGIGNITAETIERPQKDVVVSYVIDSLYYAGKFVGCEIRVPVTIGDTTEYVLLDNGCAQYNVASESFAQRHGIYPIGTKGKAVGVTETVSMWLGTCDSLSVGELIFKDIIFVVLPDQAIDNSILHFNAALGGGFFRLADEIILDNQAQTITFPQTFTPQAPNVTMDEDGVHFVNAIIQGDTLLCQLDMGATRTSLNVNYYKKHKRSIRHQWTVRTSHIGGVGKLKSTKVYTTPQLAISACGGTFIKQNIEVDTNKRLHESTEYGALGNDFILSFNKVTINLHQMYLIVE